MASNEPIDYDALVREDRVHSRVYDDPQIFEDEVERVFHRGWVFVGHASEITNPGDYRLAWAGRDPIIIVRGEDGEIRLLSNRCRHRANTVCQIKTRKRRVFPLRLSWMGLPQRDFGHGHDDPIDNLTFLV